MTERIPYAKKEFKSHISIHKEWKVFDGAQGCTPLEIDGLGLRMDRLPLPLIHPASMTDPAPAPRSQTEKPPPVEASKGIREWLAKAAAKPAPPPAPKKGPVLIEAWKELKERTNRGSEDDKPKAKPFDMLDIPEGMAAMGFSKGKLFAERWFNGRAFVGPTNKEEKNGSRYPVDMMDDKTIKMAWLLGFDSIEDKHDVLIESLIHSINAKKTAKESIERFLKVRSRFNGTLHTRKYCGDDLQRLHHEFQFQFIPITDLDTLKSFAPTDLTASLGSFNLYASIASMDITTDVYNRYDTPTGTLHCTKSKAVITHVWVYAKDSYSFQDDDRSSQYLGHWNRNGMIVLPIAAAAGKLGKLMTSKSRFEIGDWDVVHVRPRSKTRQLTEADIYTSVRNRNYVEWRNKHGRGGDFVIYSDFKRIELDDPIHIDLEEICR